MAPLEGNKTFVVTSHELVSDEAKPSSEQLVIAKVIEFDPRPRVSLCPVEISTSVRIADMT